MNVLHVIPSIDRRFGGPPVALVGYVRAGEMADCQSTIVALADAADSADWIVSQLPGVSVHAAPGSQALWRLLGTLIPTADVVHVHGTLNRASSFGMWRAIQAGRPVVVRPFGTLSRYTFNQRRRALKRIYHAAVDAPALRRAAAVHFTTEAERDDALRLPAVDRARCYVIPPSWTPGDTSAPSGRASPAGRGVTVLFLSRLDPKKGLETLLDAWPEVVRGHASARLVIAGDGSPRYRAALETRATTSSDGRTVRFAGFVTGPAKRALLAEADLFVLPSRHENFGVAVIDALAAGLPVVVSPDVGLADFVRAQSLGRIAEPEPHALAQAINAVLSDPTFRARCAREGPRAVAGAFAPEVIAPSLRMMYHSAIAQGPAV